MRERKRSKLAAIGFCLILAFGIFGVYLVIPRNLEIAIFPPDHVATNITVMVNDEIVFSEVYNRSADTVIEGRDYELIHVKITSTSFSIQLDNRASGAMDRLSTYSIKGTVFTCRVFEDENVEMEQFYLRPDY